MGGESKGREIQSMTGFASHHGGEAPRWAWEIRSVNGKGLDVRYRGPTGLESLEPIVREKVAARFARGSLQLSLTLQTEQRAGAIRVNRDALETLLAVTRELRGPSDAPLAIEQLLGVRGVVEPAESELAEIGDIAPVLIAGLDEALDALSAARGKEGEAVAAMLAERLDKIEQLTAAAKANEARSPDAIRARLKEQLAQLIEGAPSLDQDRLYQEAALLATRADIGEELDRLDAHVAAARDLIAEGGAIGRRLDFLAQEFNRETNTLCAKANHRSLTAIGLDLKAIVDQFREQVQNLQ